VSRFPRQNISSEFKKIIPKAKIYHFIRKFHTVSFRKGIDNECRVLFDAKYPAYVKEVL